MADETLDPILDKVDPDKREFLKKVIVGTAFVAPIVSSFSLEGLSPNEAFAQSSNVSSTATTALTTIGS